LTEQLSLGRKRLLETSYADFERLIRRRMTTMFTPFGFDARRDIAGIILNRWGHARVVPARSAASAARLIARALESPASDDGQVPVLDRIR
jgi:hypothetical protein